MHRISRDGHVEVFYRGLGRPQGMAFDAKGNLYVAASLGGRRGVVRISPDAKAELFLSGPAIVGAGVLAVESADPGHQQSIYRVASDRRLACYRVNVGIEGRRDPLSSTMPRCHTMADAEIIAVGSELLTSQRVDTNSLFITDQLNALGVEVRRKLVVGDDRALLTAAVRDALDTSKSSSSPAASAPPKTI